MTTQLPRWPTAGEWTVATTVDMTLAFIVAGSLHLLLRHAFDPFLAGAWSVLAGSLVMMARIRLLRETPVAQRWAVACLLSSPPLLLLLVPFLVEPSLHAVVLATGPLGCFGGSVGGLIQARVLGLDGKATLNWVARNMLAGGVAQLSLMPVVAIVGLGGAPTFSAGTLGPLRLVLGVYALPGALTGLIYGLTMRSAWASVGLGLAQPSDQGEWASPVS